MEWGPWIEHDGNGCPCAGQYVHVILRNFGLNYEGSISDYSFGIAGSHGGESWDWSNPCNDIIKYRIRKPLGLTMLEVILNELPAPTKETVHHE